MLNSNSLTKWPMTNSADADQTATDKHTVNILKDLIIKVLGGNSKRKLLEI